MPPSSMSVPQLFPDGEYIGEVSKNLRHGNGKFTFNDGCVYVGEWVGDYRQGNGTCTWPINNREISSKKIEENSAKTVESKSWLHKPAKKTEVNVETLKPHLEDSCCMADKYVGVWKSDKMEGNGSLTWANGKGTYSGEWKDNQFDGKGCCRWPDGKQYAGEWAADKKHGRGFFRFGDGRCFEGDFEKDLPRKGLLVERDGHAFLATYTGWTTQSAWLPTSKKRVGKFEQGPESSGQDHAIPKNIQSSPKKGSLPPSPSSPPSPLKKSEPLSVTSPKDSDGSLPGKVVFTWDDCNSVKYRRFEGSCIEFCPDEGVLIKNDGMFKVKYDGKRTFAENPAPVSSEVIVPKDPVGKRFWTQSFPALFVVDHAKFIEVRLVTLSLNSLNSNGTATPGNLALLLRRCSRGVSCEAVLAGLGQLYPKARRGGGGGRL
uniref:MORN repeat-containing protein 5 n=1 Tax=Cryptomonas curvata TaxID=233186 RepID=A0A7S0QU48_9CRYP|mmetsp:Transcript_56014/g.117177  ORF Transcript_56014/g.117177 Transcript_56014/m.117177 type:complete len:431 (+) Transcript_56014:178-1470(+)